MPKMCFSLWLDFFENEFDSELGVGGVCVVLLEDGAVTSRATSRTLHHSGLRYTRARSECTDKLCIMIDIFVLWSELEIFKLKPIHTQQLLRSKET